jgi:hypothetical protein
MAVPMAVETPAEKPVTGVVHVIGVEHTTPMTLYPWESTPHVRLRPLTVVRPASGVRDGTDKPSKLGTKVLSLVLEV